MDQIDHAGEGPAQPMQDRVKIGIGRAQLSFRQKCLLCEISSLPDSIQNSFIKKLFGPKGNFYQVIYWRNILVFTYILLSSICFEPVFLQPNFFRL